jgi:hypothetical protein
MNIYEFFRLLVQSSVDMPHKDQAFELIDELEKANAFGTVGLTQVGGENHAHVLQTERANDGIRLVDRCALCRKNLSPEYFPNERNPGKRW